MTRTEQRNQALARRRAMPADEVARLSAALLRHIVEHPLFHSANVVAAYRGIGGEPALSLDPRRNGVCLPRTVRKQMRMHRWDGSPLIPGVFGIEEPHPELPVVDPSEVDLWLVPGVCFDGAGNRLGFGAGLYDRALAGVTAPRVGVAWSWQIVPQIDAEPHDVPVTAIVTEHGWFDVPTR